METKICKICGEEKEINEFYFRKDSNKYRNECKRCALKLQKEFYENNEEKLKHKKEYFKNWRENNKEKKSQTDKEYREKNKEKIKEGRKKHYINNVEKIKTKQKEYIENNKQKIKQRRHEFYLKNKEKILQINKIYRQEHKNQLREHIKEYNYNKRHKNSLYRLKCQTRKNIWASFNKKGYLKSKSTEKILGCTLDYFYSYLLETYRKNYNKEWDEIEKVDIDHIVPLDTAKTEEDVIKLCHYTNLQLLKHIDNIKKSNKLDFKFEN